MARRFVMEPLDARTLLAGAVLFVHGAPRSGGFLEATNDAQRTEQLASITNASTAAGNHGWKQLADLLRGQNYTLTEIDEPLEPNAPPTGQTTGSGLDFSKIDLKKYDAVVFASNNAVYPETSIDAIESYIRGGGGAIFISDGNFGSSWADAPNSDQQFLNRFGLTVDQDNGQYTLRRDAGDFTTPAHPVLIDVNAFDGEGVSPIRLPATLPAGVALVPLARAKGTTFDNNPASAANNSRGTPRPVDSRDASLVLGNAGGGRFAAFFDRNTFFNAGGAGTDITKNDNSQLATNLFNWATDHSPPAVVSSSFTQGDPYVLRFRVDDNLNGTFARIDIRLRSRRTGINLPPSMWRLSLSEGNGHTDVAIRIAGDAPTGPYQLRVERRRFADDSGNVRTGAIRYAFTLLPPKARLQAPAFHAVARPKVERVAQEVLGAGQ